MKTQRVIVYVDGFNLYHAVKSIKHKLPNKYINLHTLSERLLQPNQTLQEVKYFSAFAKWRESYTRHFTYVEMLKDVGVLPTMSHFKNKNKYCKSCNVKWVEHEEKETDIRIALSILMDAEDDKFDVAIVITADSDLVPVIEGVKERFKHKHVFLAIPPRRYRFARDLIRAATSAKEITVGLIKESLFSNK